MEHREPLNLNVDSNETKTTETAYICKCGRVMTCIDDADTLGSEDGLLCPDCGNEDFQSVSSLQRQRDELLAACERGRNRLLELGQNENIGTLKILNTAISNCKVKK
jgi:hypothetical protein